MLGREDSCAESCLQQLKLNQGKLVLCSSGNPVPLWSYGALYNNDCSVPLAEVKSMSWFREGCGHMYVIC